ncbi:MAG: hypothetical protein RIE24_27660 [Silicimonas sp.]
MKIVSRAGLVLGIARWVGAENKHDAEGSFDSYSRGMTRVHGSITAELWRFLGIVSLQPTMRRSGQDCANFDERQAKPLKTWSSG